jgi:spermidine/putrescine transport system ATP-binding protein
VGITTLFVTHDQEEAVMLADRIALMDGGRLLQFDRPRTLFERPQNATVARFFRNENFLPGIKRGVQVETAWGTFSISPCNPACNGPVLLTVRPEHLEIGGRHFANCIEATVLQAVYMGAHTQLQVTVGECGWLVQAPANLNVAPGDKIRLHLPEARIWCIPR